MSGNQQWEALPPRKRTRARGGGSIREEDGTEVNDDSRSKSSSGNDNKGSSSGSKDSNGSSYQTIESRTNTINDNIANRMKVVRAASTLEHKDGCAGEFFEYLDHTADVQFHVWGHSLKHAFENIAVCMFNYITDISLVQDEFSIEYRIDAHDLHSLLFEYMEELLFRFSTEGFMCKWVEVDLDDANFSLNVKCHGSKFDPTVHVQGTEIKAITYSAMQIHNNVEEKKCDIYVIVDI